ncbi:MAG: hypothetical protein GXY19_08890 [Phycisphaerae bacterium]|nr:hypothetical protein [Phycisphaerae bacterium]
MRDRNYDELRELLTRFTDSSDAGSTERDIRAGDSLFDMHPAPQAAPETLATIKRRISVRLGMPRRHTHPLYRYVGAAAAVIAMALIGFFGRSAPEQPRVSYASLIPAAIWDSDDLVSDDAELAYFRSELRHIETQMQALEAGDGELVAAGSLDEVELELIRIDTQFWKE